MSASEHSRIKCWPSCTGNTASWAGRQVEQRSTLILTQILKKLEKSNDELYEYAHVVSHDLKSPLITIDALVSWIRSDNADKFDEETLQNMENENMISKSFS